jgi:hypothetical protein
LKSIKREIPFREGDTFFDPGNAGKILVIGAVEVIERDTNQGKPRRKHAKYLDTRSGRIRLAKIADNSAASLEAFVRANVKPGATLLTDGHSSYPGLTDLSARSARGRQDGRTRRVALDSPGLLADEAVGTGHVSRPAPQACRHLSQRIRFPLQSPLSPAHVIRNSARPHGASRAVELLGYYRPAQSPKG